MVNNNYVELEGALKYPKMSTVSNGFSKFQAKLAIPVEHEFDSGEKKVFTTYVKIVAWGSVAESMGGLVEDTVVRVQGRINERSYEATCKHCGGKEKKYWTDVLVNSFVEV